MIGDLRLWPHLNQWEHGYYPDALPEYAPLDSAAGYIPSLVAITETLAANKGQLTAQVTLLAGSYLWAFASTTTQAEGFEIRIHDLASQTPISRSAIRYDNLSGQGSVQGITFPLHVLPRPRLILEPGQLTVQLRNLSATANAVQLVLYTVEPPCRPS